MERYVRKGYKIWDTYLDREVQELNYRSQSDYLCEVLNQLEREKEYYRKYAILYLKDFTLYSDDFIETMRSIYGDEFANKMLKDREEIIDALKREGLYD